MFPVEDTNAMPLRWKSGRAIYFAFSLLKMITVLEGHLLIWDRWMDTAINILSSSYVK